MKGWKLITLAAALGVVLVFGAVAIARGATGDLAGRGWGMMGRAAGDRVAGCGGVGAGLMTDPAFRSGMQKLRAEHRADVQAWWQKYGSNASSAAAQSALKELRTEHWNDMRSLFKKYGVALPQAAPAGAAGSGGCFRGGTGGQGGCGGPGGSWGDQGPRSGTGMMGGGMMGPSSI